MRIEKYKKDKGNKYKVYFDDNSIVSLYDDVIIKYNLLSNKVFDEKFFDEVISYNSFLEGYYKAIKYINTKMRTEKEIRKYLNKLCVSYKNIDEIVNLLYKDGYLNKDRYLIAYINDQYNLSINGPLKVKNSLIDLGYEEYEFTDYLYNFEWNNRIKDIVLKKIKLNHKLSNNFLKSKIINDIIKLGYKKENVIEVLDSIELYKDEDILKKELYKIKSKYSLKYDDCELEYRVINYLYKKGFNLDDIKRCYNED